MTATERCRVVQFAGDGAGAGELSWGQVDIWVKMVRLGQALAMGGVRPLARGTTVADVEDELRYVMGRYPTLRTKLVFDASGWPRQVVHERGETRLDIVEAMSEDAQVVAGQVERRYRDQPFDYAEDWPVRMAVVLDGGRYAYVVLVVPHIVMDGAASMIMMREVAGRRTAPLEGMTPIEQAQRQGSPSGQRQNSTALRYWEQHLRSIPRPTVARSRDPRSPRHWTGVFRSTALPRALKAAAAREGLEPAAALLAAFACALHGAGGPAVLPLRLTVSNRFRPGLSEATSPVSQTGLCVIDTAGGFADVLRRTHPAAMAAYKHAYYDRRDLDRLLERVAADRGDEILLDVSLNDRRAPGGLETPEEETTFEWLSADDGESSALFLNVDGDDGHVTITVYLDSHFLAPEDAEAVFWDMEERARPAAEPSPSISGQLQPLVEPQPSQT